MGDEPYEKPEAKQIDLGNMLDEAMGILQDTTRKIESLKKRVEDITADVEDICAAHATAALDIERAETLMAKVHTVMEATKNADH